MTTSGGATPQDALAADRMPVADSEGRLSYERTFPADVVPDALLEHLSELHVVQHGIDYNNNGKYDLEALGPSTFAENAGKTGVPEEVTNPAACGVVEGAGAGKPARNGIETGGAPGPDLNAPLVATGWFTAALCGHCCFRRAKGHGAELDRSRGIKLMVNSSHGRPSRLVRAVVAVGLAVIGIVLVWAAQAARPVPAHPRGGAPNGYSEPSPSPVASKPTPERSTAGADQVDVRDKITGWSCPSRTRWRCRSQGLASDRDWSSWARREWRDGRADDPACAGWFTRGAAPGALGPAVIAGHVTWDGPAVFHRLGVLKRGDRVNLTRKDGRIVTFTVTRVAQFSKSRFRARRSTAQSTMLDCD